jgi:hypothetical protein
LLEKFSPLGYGRKEKRTTLHFPQNAKKAAVKKSDVYINIQRQSECYSNNNIRHIRFDKLPSQANPIL